MRKPSNREQKKYVFKEKKDFIIFDKISQLESKKLSVEDKKLVKFLRTQLEDNWRTPLVNFLDKLLVKYNKKH
ncbi:MAG: hypothetical protein A2744_04235 [Candidatus Buchananbacteria bacterium RIFCSPHIGHO2_01_FULL_44_11]|uniref:Uncharacterized protein n=1 Tax=Candidatus Buchananbacteria bacterium RIFCSPHIGHO2_01_FULL_44_11 TaxID=1797535 RepID=A0A1G1XZM9_9BACT|nr:MAG: hypothetical protein A2744_04235 [Candidatus Buchananbacteria bacterium RIFCSPHIGHO2_01_FULL_44_11]